MLDRRPVIALQRITSVVKPDGQILLLEHVRQRNPILGSSADRLNSTISRLIVPNINRRTETNLATAGLDINSIRRTGVWRKITARSS